MSIETINRIERTFAGILARPFTHDEMRDALLAVARSDPASPAPYLAMAIAFGLGHRDLDALKQHLASAARLLSQTTLPHDAEYGFLQALHDALHGEVVLVEQQRSHPPGRAIIPRNSVSGNRCVLQMRWYWAVWRPTPER